MNKYLQMALLGCMSTLGLAKELPSIFETAKIQIAYNPFLTNINLANSYCAVNANNPEAITYLEFGQFTNTSPAVDAAGYEDFTNMIIEVNSNRSIPIKLKGNTFGDYIASFTAFIDLNQDGQFVDEERFNLGTIQNSTGLDDKVLETSLTIPAEAVINGPTRLRIMKRQTTRVPLLYASNACSLGNTYGQIEDYTINITQAQGCQTAPNGKNVEAIVFPEGSTSTMQNYNLVSSTAKTGAYTEVFLYKGNSYSFKVNSPSVLNTIVDASTNEVLVSGLGTTDYVSTINGVVRWYNHAGEDCSVDTNLYTLEISNKIFDLINDICNVGTATADFNLTIQNGGDTNQQVAFDIDVANGRTVNLSGIKINLVGNTTSINFDLLSSQNDLPGSLLQTITGSITNQEQLGTVNNQPVYQYTITFNDPVLLDGSVSNKFWLKLNSTASAIETTTNKVVGKTLTYKTNAAWQAHQNYEVVYELIATCNIDICNQSTISTNNTDDLNLITHIPDLFYSAFDVYTEPDTNLEITGLELEMWSLMSGETPSASSFVNLDLRTDLNGVPDAIVTTIPNRMVSKDLLYEFSEEVEGEVITFHKHKVTLAFDEPLIIAGNNATKYWISTGSDFYGANGTLVSSVIMRDLSKQGFNLGGSMLWFDAGFEMVYKLITNCTQASINDLENNKPQIFPNPTDRLITIKSKTKINTIEVFNLAGQRIKALNPFKNEVSLDLSEFTKGVYVLKVLDENNSINTFKIIKR